MRTLPAYYAILAVTLGQQFFLRGNHDLQWGYLVFAQNYKGGLPYLYVSWSLCVEEHFYLLIGPLLLLIARLGRPGLAVAAGVLALPALCRAMGWYGTIEETHVRFDECATGVALAAVCVFAPALWRALRAVALPAAIVGALVYGAAFLRRVNPDAGLNLADPELFALVFASFVLLAASGWTVRVPGARFVADRAYSLYLLHPEALALLRRFHLPFPVFLALAWALSFLLAEVLFRFVERPLMEARERFRGTRRAAEGAGRPA
jgi:peptidoglycan/LPS O-acetylase OafA/YrhL